MGMYESLFSSSSILNEQLAREIFDILPEDGPIMVIFDREGKCWPSDSESYLKLNLSESLLDDICAKIDDGDEPVVSQLEDYSIVGAQLTTRRTNCGYLLMALPQYSPESTFVNIDLIDIVINQVGLIAKLIEKNSLLYELQTKNSSLFHPTEPSYN